MNGLALCALLGSSYARSRPEAGAWQRAKSPATGDRWAGEFWRVIEALFDPPAPNAPAFMSHEAWRIKSCQTALAGWAHWRHAAGAHLKIEIVYPNGGPPKFRGAVEPNPEFFTRLAAFSRRQAADLARLGWLEPTPERCAVPIPSVLDHIIRLEEGRPARPVRFLGEYLVAMHSISSTIEPRKSPEDREPVKAALLQWWLAAERGAWPENPEAVKLMKALDYPVKAKLEMVAKLAEECAERARGQLEGKPLDAGHEDWFLTVGQRLAGLLGYESDRDNSPEDDVPRVTTVLGDPAGRRRLAAIGRPRALWVLYPHQGREVLCRGAVLSYYEFDGDDPPTDDDWRDRIRAGTAPPPPEWLTPLCRAGTPEPRNAPVGSK